MSAPLAHVDLSDRPDAEQAQALEAAASALQSSLNLTDGPLMRAAYLHRGGQRSARLLLIIHHLVVDVLSWRVLLEDLETAYRQIASSQAVRLPPRTTSFATWARELARYARSETVAKEAAYWLSLPWERAALLPLDRTGGENSVASARAVTTTLDADDTRVLLQELPDPSVQALPKVPAVVPAVQEKFAVVPVNPMKTQLPDPTWGKIQVAPAP